MEIVHCSFCKHGNPADAKFCNACGSSLALRLCEACGAIDNVGASACHKCGHPFAPSVREVAPDEGEAQSLTPPTRAEEPTRPGRSPWKLFALLVLVVAGTLVIYPRVAGDEAKLSAINVPVEVAAEPEASLPPADSPPALTADSAPSDSAGDTADATQAPTDAATAPVEDAPARPTTATDEGKIEPPSSAGTATESPPEEALAPTTTTQPAEAQSADVPETAPATPQAPPAGCSPAIDALGLCPPGFR